jgi:hypothetical protein
MNTDSNGFLLYAAVVAVTALIAHSCIRRFWMICVVIATSCAVLNILHEGMRHGFHIRPSDAVFWIPMLLVFGFAIAFPIAFVIGLPFHLYRRRKR